LFRSLGRYTGPEISVAAMVVATGQPPDRVRRLLTELARANAIAEYRRAVTACTRCFAITRSTWPRPRPASPDALKAPQIPGQFPVLCRGPPIVSLAKRNDHLLLAEAMLPVDA
jgi:hypothetical protein